VALTWFLATKFHSDTQTSPGTQQTPATDEPVHLLVVYSQSLTPGKKGFFPDTSGLRTASGRPIEVTGVSMGSREMIEQVLDGAIRPHAIVPSSDLYLNMADKEWSLGNGKGKPLVGEKATFIKRVYVLAIRRPMAEAMGWPNKEIGWPEVAEIAHKGWQAVGKPEWGALKILDAHPEFSDAGLQAVVSASQSTLGIPKGFTRDRLKDPKLTDLFKTLDERTVWYPTSLDDLVWNEGQDVAPHCHMAFVPEHVVITLNGRNARKNAPPAWVAVYPKGGTICEGITAGALDRDWVTETHREAMSIFFKYLLEPKIQSRIVLRGYRPALKETALVAPLTEAWGIDPKKGAEITGMPPIEEVLECEAAWQSACKKEPVKPASGTTTDLASARKASITSGMNSRITPLIQVVRTCKPCTLHISIEGERRIGSGVFVDPRGYLVTNYHVVGDANVVNVHTVDSETVLKGEVVQKLGDLDLAIVRIKEAGKYPAVPLADLDAEVGEQAVMIGNPYGYTGTVSVGIVSGLDREIPSPAGGNHKVFQMDAGINPGNSGGPVVNIYGELIGIAVAMREGAENIGFAIPVKQVREVLKKSLPK
jgi:S1-C subfamily serine protease